MEVVLPNGLEVTATVHDGLWAAWWPNQGIDLTDTALLVRTNAGTRRVDPSEVGLPWDRS